MRKSVTMALAVLSLIGVDAAAATASQVTVSTPSVTCVLNPTVTISDPGTTSIGSGNTSPSCTGPVDVTLQGYFNVSLNSSTGTIGPSGLTNIFDYTLFGISFCDVTLHRAFSVVRSGGSYYGTATIGSPEGSDDGGFLCARPQPYYINFTVVP